MEYFSPLLYSKKSDSRAILIDMKGTKNIMRGDLDELIEKMNLFYTICEGIYLNKSDKLGDFFCVTFSDTCYSEFYTEPPFNIQLLELTIDIIEKLTKVNIVSRCIMSKGYTIKRYQSLLPENKFINNLFGVGTTVLKAFEGEESHFKGTIYLERELYDAEIKNKYNVILEEQSCRNNVTFYRIK